jgi:ABC-type oligopeptide transport system substrate-binding subunit
VDIWLRQDTAVNRTGAEAVQAMLKQNLNIDVGVRNVERKVFAEALPTRELILGMVPYQYDYLDAGNLLSIWLSNGRHAWHNNRFEQLVLEANELVGDPDRRHAMYQEAERILVSDVGGVFLWYLQINQMWKPYIKGKGVEPNKWGYRAWRNDLMMHLSPTLYITKDVLKGRAKPQESKSIWQWLTGSIED